MKNECPNAIFVSVRPTCTVNVLNKQLIEGPTGIKCVRRMKVFFSFQLEARTQSHYQFILPKY